MRVAGVDWLNEHFLPSHGYRASRIQEAYAGGEGVQESPEFHLAEEGREVTLPERIGPDDYGYGGSNCSTLFELIDSIRRVVLNDELPAEERFNVAPADVAGLQDALQSADSWIGPGIAKTLGGPPDAVCGTGARLRLLNGLSDDPRAQSSVDGQLADFTWAYVRSTHICLRAFSQAHVLTLYPRASSRPPSPAASGRLNKEGGPVPSPVGWRRLGMVVVVLGLGAAAKLIRDMLSELDRSDAGDPWGPHRKGF